MTLASLTRFQADSGAKMGQLWYPLDKTPGVESDYPSGIDTLAYRVPANTRLHAKAVAITIRPNDMGNVVLNVPNGQGGIVFIAVNGTTVEEKAFYGHPIFTYAGSDEQNQPFDCQSGLPTLGEGITVNAGQAIRIGCTPRQATLQVWRVTILGKRSGVTDIQTAIVQTYLTTANQTLLTYTPANDYVVMSICISCEQPGHIFGGLQACINGQKVFEAGYLGIEAGDTSFMSQQSYAGPALGALVFPLWGIDFGEGSTFGYSPSAITDHGMHMTYSLFGTEEAIGGGTVTGATCFAF